MKTSLFAFSLSILLTLAACSSGTPTPSYPAGFSIYLLAENISPEEPASPDLAELAAKPLLSGDEIVSYTRDTHEIELTQKGYEAVAALSMPVTGLSFAVCVDGQPIYTGAFWPGYSSLSHDGVIIDPILATAQHPFIHIQLGYPGSDFYQGLDPRSDMRIMQALEQAGKLK